MFPSLLVTVLHDLPPPPVAVQRVVLVRYGSGKDQQRSIT